MITSVSLYVIYLFNWLAFFVFSHLSHECRNLTISFSYTHLLEYNMMLWILSLSLLMSVFYSLILLIQVFSLYDYLGLILCILSKTNFSFHWFFYCFLSWITIDLHHFSISPSFGNVLNFSSDFRFIIRLFIWDFFDLLM